MSFLKLRREKSSNIGNNCYSYLAKQFFKNLLQIVFPFPPLLEVTVFPVLLVAVMRPTLPQMALLYSFVPAVLAAPKVGAVKHLPSPPTVFQSKLDRLSPTELV
jgi:hypothetical protein